MSKTFAERIRAMNEMYNLPINLAPTMPDTTPEMQRARIRRFNNTLQDEVNEASDIYDAVYAVPEIDILVAMADWLGDITVYCRSEALKYGIPLEGVLEIIMDSNESKLDENGRPIYDENGKFLKGPNYWKPEPKIKELLLRKIEEAGK